MFSFRTESNFIYDLKKIKFICKFILANENIPTGKMLVNLSVYLRA